MLEAGTAQGAALVPALLPGLLAAGIGYIIYTGAAHWTGLPDVTLAVPGLPAYTSVEWPHLVIAVVIGVAVAIVAAAVHESSKQLHRRTVAFPTLVVVPIAGLLIGACAVLYNQFTGEPIDEVLFSGQAAIPEAVTIASGGTLLVLIGFKAVAYALSLGGGFRGGPVFPALFLGVCVGTGMSDFTGMSVTAGVGAGIAAGLAAMLRFPMSGVLFALLITGSAGFEATPIFIVAAVAGYVVDIGLERARAARAPAAAAASDLGLRRPYGFVPVTHTL